MEHRRYRSFKALVKRKKQLNLKQAIQNEIKEFRDNFVVRNFKKTDLKCGIIKLQYKIQSTLEKNIFRKSTFYFNIRTKEFLGSDSRKVARKANTNGVKLVKNNKFQNAKEWFTRAYMICPEKSSHKLIYKNNSAAIDFAINAQDLYRKQKFAEAEMEYDKAIKLCKRSSMIKVFVKEKQNTGLALRRNKKAKEFYDTAIQLCHENKFYEGCCYFSKAYATCSDSFQFKKFYKNCRHIAKLALQAELFHGQSDLKQAKINLINGVSLSLNKELQELLVNKIKEIDISLLEKKLTAEEYFREGLKYCTEENFFIAKSYFQIASNTLNPSHSRKYLFDRFIEMSKFAWQGIYFLDLKQYTRAEICLKKALNICTTKEISEILEKKMNKVRILQGCSFKRNLKNYVNNYLKTEPKNEPKDNEINSSLVKETDLKILISKAEELLKQDKFSKAKLKFLKILQLSSNESLNKHLINKINHITEAIEVNEDANKTFMRSLKFLITGEYEKTMKHMHLAYKKCFGTHQKKKYEQAITTLQEILAFGQKYDIDLNAVKTIFEAVFQQEHESLSPTITSQNEQDLKENTNLPTKCNFFFNRTTNDDSEHPKSIKSFRILFKQESAKLVNDSKDLKKEADCLQGQFQFRQAYEKYMDSLQILQLALNIHYIKKLCSSITNVDGYKEIRKNVVKIGTKSNSSSSDAARNSKYNQIVRNK